jgi:IS30 family transposase
MSGFMHTIMLEIPAINIDGDNGKELAEHKRIAHELDLDFIFAHPYAAWECGLMKT